MPRRASMDLHGRAVIFQVTPRESAEKGIVFVVDAFRASRDRSPPFSLSLLSVFALPLYLSLTSSRRTAQPVGRCPEFLSRVSLSNSLTLHCCRPTTGSPARYASSTPSSPSIPGALFRIPGTHRNNSNRHCSDVIARDLKNVDEGCQLNWSSPMT